MVRPLGKKLLEIKVVNSDNQTIGIVKSLLDTVL